MMDIRPNHTIYVNNLNEKIKKEGKNTCWHFATVFYFTC
jgi:hypothetical protein